MESWVTVDNLHKKIDDFELGPIDVTIEPGTIMALVGNNGSGKSTLLKLMMHLAKPDSGSIELFGESINTTDKNWKPYVAYLPQTQVGVHTFTGDALKQLTKSWYPDWDEKLFQYMVHHFNIPLRKKYTKLSPGVQQKLNLALTIARNAPFMILDEPTSFLDIPSTKLLGDILTEWMDDGERSIFMTSHQVEDIRKLSDYIAILHNGKLLGVHEKGALQERFRRYWLQEEVPGARIPGEVSRANRQLVTEDAQMTEQFLKRRDIEWFDQGTLDLEEIITILMNK